MPYISNHLNISARNALASIEERIKVVVKAFCDSPPAPFCAIDKNAQKIEWKPAVNIPPSFSKLTNL